MRLLEIIILNQDSDEIEKIINKDNIIQQWAYQNENDQIVLKILIQDEYAKKILSELEDKSGCRVVIYPVEGTLPKIDDGAESEKKKIKIGKFISVSKEELYYDIDQPVSLSSNFILMVIMSSFVAGIGILKDNVAIVIGAMVIAPFLGPNISMAFGTTLGDLRIIKKSIITGLASTLIALFISVAWGFFATDAGSITPDPEIEYRDILLALACGFAGVISALSGQSTYLVGVMVAAALLPPLFRGGLFLGGGIFGPALNSFLIFSTNIICVNIAGIITFYLAGITPGKWWEKKKAIKKTRTAFIIWIVALIVIIIAILLIQKFGK